MDLAIFPPQLHQRHSLAAQLLMNGFPVGQRASGRRRGFGLRSRLRLSEELSPELGLIDPLGQRPGHLGLSGPAEVIGDRAPRQARGSGHLADGEIDFVMES